MKALDALVSIWWSLTALATLYVVLHRPVQVDAHHATDRAVGACELPSGPVMLRVLAPQREAR